MCEAKKNPTVGKSVCTDRTATLFLESLLPADWLWRQHAPDYFVDCHVEIVEIGELTGLHFGFQIKGRKHVACKGNQPQLPMRTKHLAYYRDRARLPVFIALIDTTKKSAHWLFSQKYLRERVKQTDIESKKTLTLLFDEKDSFSDLERFRAAIKAAERYMRDLYPGSPDAAISARKAELQALDPDIDVDVSYNSGVKLHFAPKKPISLQFQGHGAKDWKSLQAMLDHGEDFKAKVGVILPESPLFQKLMASGKAVIRFTPNGLKGCVQIICGSSPQRTIQVPGLWRWGRKSIRFDGTTLEKSPLSIHLRIDNLDTVHDLKTSLETPVVLNNWEKQRVSRLAWFEEILAFITSLTAQQEFRVDYFIDGVNAGSLVAPPKCDKKIGELKSTLDWLARAQVVARHFCVDAILPSLNKIPFGTQCDVDALWGIATSNVIKTPIPGITLPIHVSRNVTVPSDMASGTMQMIGTATFDFFGQGIELSDIEQAFTEMELVNTEVVDSTTKRFTFRGRENATLTRRKVA
jgi:hypothetical protein